MEFKVRTKKLKGSSGTIRNSWAGIRSARGDIESVMRNLNIGRSTDEVRRSLKSSNENLNTIQNAANKIRTNLESIATQYEVTEKAITNQQRKKGNHDQIGKIGSAVGIAGTIARNIWKKGKKWWNNYKGDPVAVESGNFILDELDLWMGNEDPFIFSRFYNSEHDDRTSCGLGWTHSFDMKIRFSTGGAAVLLDDGSEEAFTLDKGVFTAVSGTSTLERVGDFFHYTTLEEDTFIFDMQGAFVRFEDNNQYGYSLEYSDGKLVRVVRDNGDIFAFTYCDDDPDLIRSVSDQTGRSVEYGYDGSFLVSVTAGDRVNRYEYDRSGRLTDVVDGRGITTVHNEYDDDNRVVRQFFPDDTEITYKYDDENDATIITEKDGSESYHFHDELFRSTENVYSDGTESYDYDTNNNITYETDRNGNETKYQYDNRGNVSRIVRPDGTEINMTYEKHNRPVTISVNGVRKAKMVYDKKGNIIESIDALGRKTSYKYNEAGFLTEERQPSGKVAEYFYDERNNPVKIVDEYGAAVTYEYDELNRAVSSTDARGNVTRYEYDRFGHIAGITNASGNKRSYTFNNIDKIEKVVDYNGAATFIEYNKMGFASRMTDPLGRVTEDEYDKMWNLAVRKLPNGGVIRTEYDESNRPIKVSDPLGNEITYAYDGNGNLILQAEPEGRITEYRYDVFNNLIGVTDPEGNETVYRYDAFNNLVYIRNANGGEAHLEYDDADQLIRETDALGQSREYKYSADGDVVKVIDEAGRVTVLDYVSPGKLSHVALPDGTEEFYTYDANGNLATRSNGQGHKVEFTYDELDRVIEVKGDDGEHVFYTYDAMGNMTSVTDGDGNTTTYEYTLSGQISSVTDEMGNRTEYEYDALDQIIELRKIGDNGEVHKTEYRRDIAGNVVEITDPLGFTEKYSYNGLGEITQKIDKDGYLTKFEYNKNGEVASILYDDGREVHMKHDALGKLAEVIDWTGTTKVESDILGRITKVIYPDERIAEYTYGKTGERTSLTHPDGRVVKYDYDKSMHLSTLTEGDTSVKYGYDDFGRIVSKTFASGLTAKYAYDTKGQVTEMTSTRGGEILESVKVKYDGYGNKLSADRMRAGIPEESGLFEYGYDKIGRLTSVTRDGVKVREYGYDSFGNRSYVINNGARTDYRYDAMDRLLETSGAVNETFRYDKRGNVIERCVNGAVVSSFVYGASNALDSVSGINGTASYEYNGLGHRIGETVSAPEGPEHRIQYTVDMTKYFNNLLERNVDGESQAYIFDGIPVAVKGSSSYEFVADEMGSPVRLLGMDGANAETYGYDEFGSILHDDGDLQPFRYMGYRKEAAAGMYYVQAREYMPEHGRFAAQDVFKGNTVNPETLNNYTYVQARPLIYYDPDGRICTPLIGAAVGGIVGGGFELGKQLVKAAVKGEKPKINWAKVGTSALGGAIEGGLIGAGCPPVAAAGISGFVESGAEAYIVDGKTVKESLVEGVKGAVIGMVFAKAGEMFKKTGLGKKIDDLTKNAWDDQYKGDMKIIKRLNDAGRLGDYKVKARTIAKGIVGGIIKKGQGYLKPGKWVKKIINGWNPICYGRSIADDPRKIVDAL